MSRVEWSVVTSLKVELSGVTSFKRKKMFYQNWTDNPMFKWKVVLLWEWYVVVNIKFLQPLSEAVGPEVLPPKWGGTNSSADICLGGQVILFVCDTFLHMSRSLLILNLCVLSGKIHISGREASSRLSFNVISFTHNIKGLISFIHYIKGFQICHRGSPRGKIFESLIWKMTPIYGAIVNNFTLGFGL